MGCGRNSLVEIDVPIMLRRERPHGFQEVALCIIALFGRRADVRHIRAGALGQARKVPGEQRWPSSHAGRSGGLGQWIGASGLGSTFPRFDKGKSTVDLG